MLKKLDLKT